MQSLEYRRFCLGFRGQVPSLRLSGYNEKIRVIWNDINLQDTLELSQARLNNARAVQIEKEIGLEVVDE